jgi:hypothetical protein
MSNSNTNDAVAQTDQHDEHTLLVNRRKFWPQAEHYCLVGLPNPNQDQYALSIDADAIKHYGLAETIAKYNLQSMDSSGKLCDYVPGTDFVVPLQHPSWSVTVLNFAQDLGADESGRYVVPLPITSFDDNSAATGKHTYINEVSNGVCPVVLSVFSEFFKIFDFTKEENRLLIDNVYGNKNEHKYTPKERALPDIKKFIDYYEDLNRRMGCSDFNYVNAQLMQSLIILCDFLDCKILRDLAISKFAFYIDFQINYYNSMRNQPDKLKAMLAPGTDMSWIKTPTVEDDIAELLSQWTGSPSPRVRWEAAFGTPEEVTKHYSAFKDKTSCLFMEEPDPDWEKIEEESKKAGINMEEIYMTTESTRHRDIVLEERSSYAIKVNQIDTDKSPERVAYLEKRSQVNLKPGATSAAASAAASAASAAPAPANTESGDDDDDDDEDDS